MPRKIRKQLDKNPMPSWLATVTPETPFDRNKVLANSVYYPGCEFDGAPFEAYGGFTHSFVYADYFVEREWLTSEIPKIAGYTPIFIKDVSKQDLAPNPCIRLERKARDFHDWRPNRTMADLVRSAISNINSNVTPYCIWTVFERRSTVNPGHGPERFSLLYIFGEGVATYESIYNGNRICPSAIVLNRADTGFGRNWTIFEQRDSIFERVVKANPAGLPRYLFTFGYGPPEHENGRIGFEGKEFYWENYTRNIPDRGYLHIWESDAQR